MILKTLILFILSSSAQKCSLASSDFAVLKTQNTYQALSEDNDYIFSFQFDSAKNFQSRTDWELHAILDFMPQNKKQNENNNIQMVMKPNTEDTSILECDLVLQQKEFIIKKNIFQIKQFWDQKLQLKLVVQDQTVETPFCFLIYNNDEIIWSSTEKIAVDSQNSGYLTDKEIQTFIINTEGVLIYTPTFKFLRFGSTFQETFSSKFKNLENTLSKHGQSVEIFDQSMTLYSSYNFKFQDGVLDLYDNMAQINKTENLNKDGLKIEQLSTSSGVQINMVKSIQSVQLVRNSPLNIKLEQFIDNHPLVLSLQAKANVQNYPIKVYLQQSEFPFEIVSDIDIMQATSRETLQMILYPYLVDDSQQLNLVFEIVDPIDASITLSNLVLMRHGIGCLPKPQDYYISLTSKDEALSYGFNNQHKELRSVFIGFAAIIILLMSAIMIFTIFKSIEQKNFKLEVLIHKEKSHKLQNAINQLQGDRQVLLAIQHLENQQEYASIGNKNIVTNESSNPLVDTSARASNIGLLQKNNETPIKSDTFDNNVASTLNIVNPPEVQNFLEPPDDEEEYEEEEDNEDLEAQQMEKAIQESLEEQKNQQNSFEKIEDFADGTQHFEKRPQILFYAEEDEEEKKQISQLDGSFDQDWEQKDNNSKWKQELQNDLDQFSNRDSEIDKDSN